MPDGEPVRVEAERVAEGTQLAARGQRVEGEHGNVDTDNSGQRLIVLQNGINSSEKQKNVPLKKSSPVVGKLRPFRTTKTTRVKLWLF
jgi:hypothetical protein